MTLWYRQCTLSKPSDKGPECIYYICWLPESVAKKRKNIRIKGKEGIWSIVVIGQERLPHDRIEENSKDYRSQRGSSDI